MSRHPGSSRRPLRLVQPFDDDASDPASGTALSERRSHHHAESPGQSLSSVASSAHLESIHTAHARSGELRREVHLRSGAHSAMESASSLVLPVFPSRRGHHSNAGGSSSIHLAREGYSVEDPVSASALSTPEPAPRQESSVDRLASLYQQYQMPATGSDIGAARKEARHGTRSTTSSGSLPVHHPANVSAPQDGAANPLSVSAPLSPHSTSESAPRQSHEGGGVRRDQPRTAHPSRLFLPTVSPSPAERSSGSVADASTVPLSRAQTRQLPGSAIVALPPALSKSGVSGMMYVAVHLWAVLGFFEMRPREGDEVGDTGNDNDDDAAAEGEAPFARGSTFPEPSDPRDTEAFLFALENFLCLFESDAATVRSETLSAHTALMRNGLWRVLFNAVFYCVTVLDARRRRRVSMSSKEGEVRTGGPEDAYEVVFPSSSSAGSADDGEDDVERQAPVRLTWRIPGESAAQRAARCTRDPIPTESSLWFGGPHGGPESGEQEGHGYGYTSSQGTPPERRAPPSTQMYGGRLRAPLPVAEWYFTLRCLAQVGYKRDSFYLQTPSAASPAELLLALLWLTQQYKLLAVAEYVELNRRYGFLLQHHVEDTFWKATSSESGAVHSTVQASQLAQARERLLGHFSHAAVWPPVSFDESSTIQLRLVQLERCLGRSSPTGTPQAHGTQRAEGSTSTLEVRRLLAVRRLISLSLNRLQHALQRQVEQILQLGLHSSLDAQLCRKEHHNLYEEVMAGLQFVQHSERRMKAAADGLTKGGLLVVFLLRYEESVVPADEVLLALEEDDATWLDNSDIDEGKEDLSGEGVGSPRRQGVAKVSAGTAAERWRRAVQRGTLSHPSASSLPTSAAAVVQSLSTFRATHSRAALTETWKRLLRRSHVAPQTILPENLRFLLDVEAQEIQEARVRENMKSRYSLQAALAAELAVMSHEQQQQRMRRNEVRSPRRQAGERGDRRVEESTSSQRTLVAATDVAMPAIRVALPIFDLVTNASAAFAQLRAEEEAYGPVSLGTAEMQLTEVGEPAAGSTTSARLELERLAAWEEEVEAQLHVRVQAEQRVAHCKEMLSTLYQQFGLRMATPIVPRRVS